MLQASCTDPVTGGTVANTSTADAKIRAGEAGPKSEI